MSKKTLAVSLSLLCALSFAGCGNKSVNNASNVKSGSQLMAFVPSSASAVVEINHVPAVLSNTINNIFMDEKNRDTRYAKQALERVIEEVSENPYEFSKNRLTEWIDESSDEDDIKRYTNRIEKLEPLAKNYDDFLKTCWTNPSEEALRTLAKDIDCKAAQNADDCTCVYYYATLKSDSYYADDSGGNDDEYENVYDNYKIADIKYVLEEYDEAIAVNDNSTLNDYLKQYGFLPLEQTQAVAYVDNARITVHVTIADQALVNEKISENYKKISGYEHVDQVNGWSYLAKDDGELIFAARADEGILTLTVVPSLKELAQVPQKATTAFDRSKFIDSGAAASYWMDRTAFYRSLLSFPIIKTSLDEKTYYDIDGIYEYCRNDDHEDECDQYRSNNDYAEIIHKAGLSTWSDDVCINDVKSLLGGLNTVSASLNATNDGTVSLKFVNPIDSKETASFIEGLVVPHDIYYSGSEDAAGVAALKVNEVFLKLTALTIQTYQCSPLQNYFVELQRMLSKIKKEDIVIPVLNSTVFEGSAFFKRPHYVNAIFHVVGNPKAWLKALSMFDAPQEGQLGGDDEAIYYKGEDLFIATEHQDLTRLKPTRTSSSFFEGMLGSSLLEKIYDVSLLSNLSLNVYYNNSAIHVDFAGNINTNSSQNENDEDDD